MALINTTQLTTLATEIVDANIAYAESIADTIDSSNKEEARATAIKYMEIVCTKQMEYIIEYMIVKNIETEAEDLTLATARTIDTYPPTGISLTTGATLASTVGGPVFGTTKTLKDSKSSQIGDGTNHIE